MKLFKFISGASFYAFSGETLKDAQAALFDTVGAIPLDRYEEIPELKWDEKFIKEFENEDSTSDEEPVLLSIRDVLYQDEPALVFTNDSSMF